MMFGWFKPDPEKQLRKQLDAKREEAINFQRNGKIREFAQATKEAEELEDKLIELRAQG